MLLSLGLKSRAFDVLTLSILCVFVNKGICSMELLLQEWKDTYTEEFKSPFDVERGIEYFINS